MEFLRTAWSAPGRFTFRGKRWRFDDIVIEPRPIQQPHPPFWMAAGSDDSIRKAAREDYKLLLDQIAPVDQICERVALYQTERAQAGLSNRPHQIAVARALQIVRSETERAQALELRTRVLRAIGGLARGPGADRYRTIAASAGAELAAEESALLGTKDEIIARLRKLQAGGVDYVLLVDPTGSIEALRTFADEIMPLFANVADAPSNPSRAIATACRQNP